MAQGLAFGAGKPVLPIDSLLLVAEDARAGAEAVRVWATIDARMNQIYAAEYAFANGRWTTLQAPMLSDAEALSERWRGAPAEVVAGDAIAAFAGRLDTGPARLRPEARASAGALVALAEAAWRAGAGVDAAEALPLYVRDKVAETTREREARPMSAEFASRLERCAGREPAADDRERARRRLCDSRRRSIPSPGAAATSSIRWPPATSPGR